MQIVKIETSGANWQQPLKLGGQYVICPALNSTGTYPSLLTPGPIRFGFRRGSNAPRRTQKGHQKTTDRSPVLRPPPPPPRSLAALQWRRPTNPSPSCARRSTRSTIPTPTPAPTRSRSSGSTKPERYPFLDLLSVFVSFPSLGLLRIALAFCRRS